MIRISGRTRVLSLVLTAALAGLGTAAQSAEASPQPHAAVHPRPVLSHAQATAALSRAQRLLHGTKAQARAVQRHEDATMLLRDLRVAYPALGPSQRQQADRLLARPSGTADGSGDPVYTGPEAEECSATYQLCVHYDLSTDDATNGIDPTDNNANGFPDYADQALATLEHVRTTYKNAGYRTPLDDSASTDNGGTGASDPTAGYTDIYLAELGDQGLYGYCTSDDPNLANTTTFYSYASAYCVLDNDYSHAEYPSHTALQNLQVTAAHEFFHAVQFSYDFFEDSWIMEATATWAEDQLYTTINDNVQYLPISPITAPGVPLDYGTTDRSNPLSLHWYGDWIFFRFLTEREVTTKVGGLPVLIRDIWRRLDANHAANPQALDEYSLQGVKNALAVRHVSFTKALSTFDLAARHPTKYFSEARANHYPSAPVPSQATAKVGPGHKSIIGHARLMHLTYAVFRLVPVAGTSNAWHVRLHFNLPARSRGSAATLWTNQRSGRTSARLISLNSAGDATVSIPFNAKTVRNIEIETINASTRSRCWSGGPSTTTYYSCFSVGSPDDGLQDVFTATAYKS